MDLEVDSRKIIYLFSFSFTCFIFLYSDWVLLRRTVLMSRSYKKHPLIQGCGDKSLKKIFNRRLRRRKQLDYPSGNAYRREPNNSSFDICDVLFGYFRKSDIPDNDERPYWWWMK